MIANDGLGLTLQLQIKDFQSQLKCAEVKQRGNQIHFVTLLLKFLPHGRAWRVTQNIIVDTCGEQLRESPRQ